ncbi:thiol:disulfide interchange protein DsbA/DsbL [Rheinheimera sp.]|uniref:thiol:disulfide interchange protein DsbA/DsbL n=1 Tax=Rheinheimera sp. TaxID=1869214 RepID=UPI00307EAE6E
MLRTLLAALVLLPSLLLAAQFEAGKHYEVLETPKTATPEVVEFFSFYCPHCKAFEPFAQQLNKSLPKGQKLIRNHVDFLRAAPAELQAELGKAYLVAESAGQGDRIADAIFNYLHQQRASFSNAHDIRSLMLVNDIPAMVYDAGVVSPKIQSEAQVLKQRQEFYTQAEALRGVPTLIVNGKYRVKLDGLDSAQFQQQLNDLVAYLLAKKD